MSTISPKQRATSPPQAGTGPAAVAIERRRWDVVWPARGLGYVSGHSAVAVALATVASYLGRRGRRVAWTLAATVCLARIYAVPEGPRSGNLTGDRAAGR